VSRASALKTPPILAAQPNTLTTLLVNACAHQIRTAMKVYTGTLENVAACLSTASAQLATTGASRPATASVSPKSVPAATSGTPTDALASMKTSHAQQSTVSATSSTHLQDSAAASHPQAQLPMAKPGTWNCATSFPAESASKKATTTTQTLADASALSSLHTQRTALFTRSTPPDAALSAPSKTALMTRTTGTLTNANVLATSKNASITIFGTTLRALAAVLENQSNTLETTSGNTPPTESARAAMNGTRTVVNANHALIAACAQKMNSSIRQLVPALVFLSAATTFRSQNGITRHAHAKTCALKLVPSSTSLTSQASVLQHCQTLRNTRFKISKT